MTTAQTGIEMIQVSDCVAHPDNPRLFSRPEVIDAIASSLADEGFKQQHAIHVRPIGGHYQIIAGHHRIEAAKKAGVAQVPAWVEDMDDDEALWRLGLDNRQSGMEPLEWGKWILDLKRRKLRKGAETAKSIGKSQPWASTVMRAAEVHAFIYGPNHHHDDDSDLPDYNALAIIATTEAAHWPSLVEAAKNRTRDQITSLVKQIKSVEIEDRWKDWLPAKLVVDRMISGEGMSPATIAKLQSYANSSVAKIDAECGGEAAADFTKWLHDQMPGTWDTRVIDARERELLQEARAASDAIRWREGRWQDHIDELDDGSVALLLTDPPYGMDYQSQRRKEKHAKIANDTADGVAEDVAACFAAMYDKMQDNSFALVFCKFPLAPFENALTDAGFTIRRDGKPLVWVKHNHGSGDLDSFAPQYEPIVVAMKGKPKLLSRVSEVLQFGRPSTDRHPTEKPIDMLQALIQATTAQGEVVADPYGGVASTAVAAKSMRRGAWSCELSSEYHAIGAERLADEN